MADRDNTLHRAVAHHVAAVTLERDAERDLERLGVVRGTFDGWRFGPASTVLHDPDDLGHSRYRKGDRAMVFVERPIDAVAYERAPGKQHATCIYTGDNPSAEAERKIAHILADAPPDTPPGRTRSLPATGGVCLQGALGLRRLHDGPDRTSTSHGGAHRRAAVGTARP